MNANKTYRSFIRAGARALLLGALFLAPVGLVAAQTAVDPDVARRTQWFHEAKFGMLITWGLYSIPAGEWKGQEIPGIGEWIQNRAHIPLGGVRPACPAIQSGEVQCRRMGSAGEASRHAVRGADAEAPRWFCPVRHQGEHLQRCGCHAFPPRPDAGVGGGVPQARAAHGLLLLAGAGLASTGRRVLSRGQWDPAQQGDFDDYLNKVSLPQVRELLTNYGPIALLWFDTPLNMTPARAQRFVDLVRAASARLPDQWTVGNQAGRRLFLRWETTRCLTTLWGALGRLPRRSTTPGVTKRMITTGSPRTSSSSGWSTS